MSVFLFKKKKKKCDKTTYKEFIMTSRISTVQWSLYAGNKKSGTSFKWSLVALYRQLLYREKFDLKIKGRTTTWLLRAGDCFEKVVVKRGLTVIFNRLKLLLE